MKKLKGPAIIITILIGFAILEWYPRTPATPPAPIQITWRPSSISGLVMQVQNTSGQHLSCALVVMNTTQGQHQNYSFSLDPYKQQEIGLMEANWKFEHGEWGNIKVEGYAEKEYTVP